MAFSRHLPETRTLLGAQFVFNVGFYAVIPFLTGALSGEYGMDAAAVGLVLGARTFSQQGMFLAGGLLADRWGSKRSILLGCLVRIAGYATLAGASDFPVFLLGAVLTGAGGALFSPALESQLSRADDAREAPQRTGSRRSRRSVFVWLAMTGEFGALLGPLVGASLLGWGLDAALAFGIAVFSVVTILLWFRLPAEPGRRRNLTSNGAPARRPMGVPGCLRNRRFVLFCFLVSVNMLAYNQLYFTVPLELDRRGLDQSWLALLFLMASVLTLVLQLPVATAMQRLGEARAMPVGFLLLAGAFALTPVFRVASGSADNSIVPLAGVVALLILGHMCLTPTILAVIPRFLSGGSTEGRGAYYGLAATCGGIAVLVGNAAVGQLGILAEHHGWWSEAPWLLLVVLAGVSATALPLVIPKSASPRLPANVPG